MTLISLSVLVLVLVKIVSLEEANNHEFNIISTSQRPPQNQLVDEHLAKVEEKFYAKLSETSRRLEAVELQNKQMQKTLENMNIALTNFIDFQTKLTSNQLEATRKRTFPKNCKEVQERGSNVSHIYRIKPDFASTPFSVLCNMDTKGGGWTYVLSRFDGSQDFYLNWTDYKNGFGNLAGESWLGLEHLYQLTGDEVNELLIEVVDKDQRKGYAHYTTFSIGNESEGYALKLLAGYNGNAGDCLKYHRGMKFSTKDKDNDSSNTAACAIVYTAGWWYQNCYKSQLTGKYFKEDLPDIDKEQGIKWIDFHGKNNILKQARMMIKPKDNTSPALVPHENKS